MSRKKVLIILPNKDFDITETSIPWNLLTLSNVIVQFATEDGQIAQGDPILLNPVVFGLLGATDEAKKLYFKMIDCPEFKKPWSYEKVDFMIYDAIIFPGGHAQGKCINTTSKRILSIIKT